MKKLWTMLFVLMIMLPLIVKASGFKQLTALQQFDATSNVPDTTTNVVYVEADSVNVTVVFQDGTPTTTLDSVWYNSGDAQATSINDQLYFFDVWDDMNGAEGVGIYTVTLVWWNGTGSGFGFEEKYTVYQTTMSLQQQSDSLRAALDSAQAIMARLINTQDTVQGVKDLLVFFDTLIYIGPRGLGIYLDSTSGNTNTVLGVDGTASNPVSTLVAARTLSDALSVKRYYFINRSTFLGATVDLAADHQDFEFIGMGHNSALAFGGQRVDGSRFDNMILSGAMHASGGDVLYENCDFGFISANFNGTASNCWLTDTIVVKADRNIQFSDCQSEVVGNETPTIDFSGASTTMAMRNYSGGIRIRGGSNADTISIETDGQVIISANNTSLNITLRGMMTVTDSGTTTALTRNAAFDSAYVYAALEQLMIDSSIVRGDSSMVVTFQQFRIVDGLDAGNVFYVANTSSTGEANAVEFYVSNSNGRPFKIHQNGAGEGMTVLGGSNGLIIVGSIGDPIKLGSSGGGEIDGVIIASDTLIGGERIAYMVPWGAGDSAAYQGSGSSAPDSAGLSRILHRIVWGTPVGSGSDSSTIAQRDATVAAIVNDIITAASIASAAIGATEIGVNAIGASELAPDAIGSSQLAASAVDEIVEYDTSNVSGTQSWVQMLKDTSAYQGSGNSAPDSATLSRILHRVVWGTSKAAGTDSSINTERDIIVAAFITDIITANALHGDAAKEIGDTIKNDAADYKADVSGLATSSALNNVQDTVTYNRDAIDSTNTAATYRWNLLMQFLGWGEISGDAIWSQDRPNANADTLWVGTSDEVSVIDTAAYQVIFHVGGTADDPPDSTKAYLWP